MTTSADGLVKLWGVRSSECTATFDEHDGKVPRQRPPAPGLPLVPLPQSCCSACYATEHTCTILLPQRACFCMPFFLFSLEGVAPYEDLLSLPAGADQGAQASGGRILHTIACEQVWALAVGGEQERLLATGGADARVNVWRDATAEDEAAARSEAAAAAGKAQDLANALEVRCARRNQACLPLGP